MHKAPECGLAKSAESELTRGAERIAADILGGIRIRAAAETNTVIAGREAIRGNCKDDAIDLASLLWREVISGQELHPRVIHEDGAVRIVIVIEQGE